MRMRAKKTQIDDLGSKHSSQQNIRDARARAYSFGISRIFGPQISLSAESSFLHGMPFEHRVSGIVSSPSDRPFADYSLRVRPYDMMQKSDGERIQVLSAWAHGFDRPHHTREKEDPSAQFPTH